MGAPWDGSIYPGMCCAPYVGDCSSPLCTPRNEHPLPAPYSNPKSRLWNPKPFLLERSQILQECRNRALCLIPQNKQDFFFLSYFFSLFSFFPPSLFPHPQSRCCWWQGAQTL